jgi:hypothetical protein
MSMPLVLLITVTLAFGALTAVALLDVGYLGILLPHFQSWGAAQVFFDLVVVAALACVWMVHDARSRGRNPWPFVMLTLIAGCFGVLFYLIGRELQREVSLAEQEA